MYDDKVKKINALLEQIEMFRTNSFSFPYKKVLDDTEEVLKFTLNLIEGREKD